MNHQIFGVSTPYYTCPNGYNGRHRDTSEQANTDGIRDDYRAMRMAQFPESHYRARHSAYAPRAAA